MFKFQFFYNDCILRKVYVITKYNYIRLKYVYRAKKLSLKFSIYIYNFILFIQMRKNENCKNENTKKNICIKCGKNAVYNTIGETNGIYCKDHKIENMIDVRVVKVYKTI
jgi:hypothetical protein